LLVISVIAGLDPIAEVYTWLAGFASVGVVLLYALTSAAVVAFFARNPEVRGADRWRTTIAPGLGLVGLIAFFVIILQNLKTLVGGSTPLAIGILVLLAATLAAGPVVARRQPAER
jgi:amino acid transporter